MTYTAKLFVDGEFVINLFDLEVEKSEIKDIEDAVFCEMKFVGFNFIL